MRESRTLLGIDEQGKSSIIISRATGLRVTLT
jgi:hypothetical protein